MLPPLIALAAVTLAAASPRLVKRCSPVYDPDYYGGYLPPVACWHEQDTACGPYIGEGTSMLLDADHGLAVIYGVSDTCADTIQEELSRAADGRKVYGWLETHGALTLIEGGILVISGMSEGALEMYEGLGITRIGWGINERVGGLGR